MSATEEMNDYEFEAFDGEPRLSFDLSLSEAEAVRVRLLKPAADGTTSLDDPLVNGVLAMLGRAVDAVHATQNIRHELTQAGLEVAHLSDDQVRDLARRISEAAAPAVRS